MKKSPAITLLRKALRYYQHDQGAGPRSSYRDAVTDLLLIAFHDKRICKFGTSFLDNTCDLKDIAVSAHLEFEEELEQEELDKVNAIPAHDLPLHSVDEFNFDSVKTAFEERLKKGSSK